MKIERLRLENFQNFRDIAFNFNGQKASIYGENGTGKTTVYNALTWLLFNCSSTGEKGYTPKTIGPDGYLHGLDHVVEAQFILDKGARQEKVTFRKVFREDWKKKRGAAEKELNGHTVKFFIDGVPKKEKDYTAELLNYCGGAERMRILTMPRYFSRDMPWEVRRKILFEVCGDVSDSDVIASTRELAELADYLRKPDTTDQYYTVDEYKKIAAAQETKINKRLQVISACIDEAQRAIPEGVPDSVAIEARLAALREEWERLSNEQAAVLAGDTSASEARKKVAEAEADLAKARTTHLQKAMAANQEVRKALTDSTRRLSEAAGSLSKANEEAARLQLEIQRMSAHRENLLAEIRKGMAEKWDEKQSICPTCHRPLPEKEVEKLKDDFERDRIKRLNELNEQGCREASQDKIEDLQRQADQAKERADFAAAAYQRIEKELDALQAQLAATVPFENTEEYARLFSKLEALRTVDDGAARSVADKLATVKANLLEVDEERQRLEQQKGQIAQAQAQAQRITELEAREKELSAQYEELEKGIFLCEQFTRAKVRMLTDRINGKFKNVSFRLFVEQLNGGIKDDCEVLVPNENGAMIPYRDANNAACINAGLEIIGILAAHWQMSMPIFLDNAESVTHLLPTNLQLIRFVVSEKDKNLRLVLDQ